MQQEHEPVPSSPSKSLQWALLIIATILTLVAILAIVFVYYVSKSFSSSTIVAVTESIPLGLIWTLVGRLFPKDPREYELAKLRIEHPVPENSYKGPISRLISKLVSKLMSKLE